MYFLPLMFFILPNFCDWLIPYGSADELPYILNDDDYISKYRASLKAAVLRAKACSWALFEGYDVCISAHAQPPPKTLSLIVKSAGGNVSSLLLYKSRVLGLVLYITYTTTIIWLSSHLMKMWSSQQTSTYMNSRHGSINHRHGDVPFFSKKYRIALEHSFNIYNLKSMYHIYIEIQSQ